MAGQAGRFTEGDEKGGYTPCGDLSFKRLHQLDYLERIFVSRSSISPKYQNAEYQSKV